MICSVGDTPDSSYCTAYTISEAVDKKIAIRILNSSSSNVELHAGQKVAKFWSAVELVSTEQHSNSIDHGLCASLSDTPTIDPQTLHELTESLSPSLSAKDKQQLLSTLISFPDAANKGLGHTSVLAHYIGTGSSAPIRQYPRRLHFTTGMRLINRSRTCYKKG